MNLRQQNLHLPLMVFRGISRPTDQVFITQENWGKKALVGKKQNNMQVKKEFTVR